MKEDALRALRALRFASRFGFRLEAATEQAVRNYLPRALQLSAERVLSEWKTIIVGPYAKDILISYRMELEGLLPHSTSISQLQCMHHLANDFALRMAALLPLTEVESWWTRWKGDKKSLKVVRSLIEGCALPLPQTKSEVHRWLTLIPLDYRDLALPLWIEGHPRQPQITTWHEELLMSHAPLTVRDLAINGHDLHRLNVPHTLRAMLLESLLDEIIKEKLSNRHSELVNRVPLLVAKLSDEKLK
jgi:hypothetical protein